MLPLLLAFAASSSAADFEDEIQEEIEYVEEEDDEEEYFEEEYVEEEDEYEYDELAARDERWFAERAFHFALHANASIGVASDDPLLVVGAAVGFSQRLAQRFALQGRASIGGGFSNTDGQGLLGGGPSLIDSSVDLTGRVGSRRFYFGFGTFGRIWRVFERGRSVAGGGGGLLELGLLFGEDRQLDVGGRLHIGGFFTEHRDLEVMVALGLSIGWVF